MTFCDGGKPMKKLYCFLAVILLALVLSISAAAEPALDPESRFEGSRTVCYVMDRSELENYVTGGRKTLETCFRVSRPSWLSVSYRTQETEVYLTLSFPFESFADYQAKLGELMGRDPVIYFRQEEGRSVYTEAFSAMDLLGFVRNTLEQQGLLQAYAFDRLVRFSSGEMVLNDQTYDTGRRFGINNDALDLQASAVSVSTLWDGSGFSRTIRMIVADDQLGADTKDRLYARFESGLGELSSASAGSSTTYTAHFTADTMEQLMEKSILLLDVEDSVDQTAAYLDDDNVTVRFQENLDVSSLMDPDTGRYTYVLILPDEFRNINLPEDTPCTAEGQQISCAVPGETVEFSYERLFAPRDVSLTLDLSSQTGRMEAVLRCTVDLSVADAYHQQVKNDLQQTLCNGQVLNIYDQEDCRVYEIRTDSWFLWQFRKMLGSQLDGADITLQRSFGPWKDTSLDFTWQQLTDAFCQRAGRVQVQVLMPKTILSLHGGSDEVQIADNRAEYTWKTGLTSLTLAYRDFSLRTCLPLLLVVLLGLVLVLLAVRALKKHRRRRKNRTSGKKTQPAATGEDKKPEPQGANFCPNCGRAVQPDSQFCPFCGTSL